MSVRTALEGLVKWISELPGRKQSKPPSAPLPHEAWEGVKHNLDGASEKFREASLVLLATTGGAVLAEFARDLRWEAEALAFRAYLLARRTPGKREPPKPKTVRKENDTTADGKKNVAAHNAAPALKDHDGNHAPSEPAVFLVKSAIKTVETAHQKLDAVHPDAVAKAFEEELDVLAEMTLSLHHQCERLEDERNHSAMKH
jgi:hypothetical protein